MQNIKDYLVAQRIWFDTHLNWKSSNWTIQIKLDGRSHNELNPVHINSNAGFANNIYILSVGTNKDGWYAYLCNYNKGTNDDAIDTFSKNLKSWSLWGNGKHLSKEEASLLILERIVAIKKHINEMLDIATPMERGTIKEYKFNLVGNVTLF